MQGITSLRSAENTTGNEGVTSTEQTEENSSDSSEFDTLLRSMVTPDGANQVNEEELFAGIIFERLKASKGDEAAQAYSAALETEKTALKKGDGYIPYEDAAKNALRTLRTGGTLTSEEADKIYSESFEAAQLDSNTGALYDGRGGANDPTIALALLDSALASSKLLVEKFVSGEQTAAVRSLDEASNGSYKSSGALIATGDVSAVADSNTPTGTTFDGADGFLFKPQSSTDNKLAILMPELLAHQVLSLLVKDENGNTLEEGRSTGYGDLGTREKFAFTKSGGDYGKNLSVQALLTDGTVKEWKIPDPTQRYD